MIYRPKGTQTAAAKSVLGVISSATVRPRIQRITGKQIGTTATDAQTEVQCSRITTTGTSTAVTAGQTDNNDPGATGLTFGSNFSAEPTYTANSLFASLIFNPRGKDEWVAEDRAAEILLPPTASNGIGTLLNTLGGATTVVCEATVQN